MSFDLSCLLAIIVGLLASVSGLPDGRIVGGQNANVGQFPHQVSLQVDGYHICGGSILNERFILTAAHCVCMCGIEPYPPDYFQVRVGSIKHKHGGKLLKLKSIVVNPYYDNLINDLAILELEQPLKWTKKIKPIEMATTEVPPGEDIIVSGWGLLYEGGPAPHRMQWNTLKALNTEQCYEAIGLYYDSVICLAHSKNNGACNGDSGGPATYKGELVGVASFKSDACGSHNPDGYAKVSYHYNWIVDTMAALS